MQEDENQARKKIIEIKKRLNIIEKKVGKKKFKQAMDYILKELPKKGITKILSILNKMIKQDASEHIEIGRRQKGSLKTDYGIRIKFLDKKKD